MGSTPTRDVPDPLGAPRPKPTRDTDGPQTGALYFTEARLVAYPARSISRPFLHVTCPLILEQLERDLRAFGLRGPFPERWPATGREGAREGVAVSTASAALAGSALVIEDLVYGPDEVVHAPSVAGLARALADLLPADDEATRDRLADGLVVIPDADFADLIQRAVPVQARIKLTAGKTTGPWVGPDGREDNSGNLWYEEHLPSDCLLIGFIGERRQRRFAGNGGGELDSGPPPLSRFREGLAGHPAIQIGGNETVGQGLCYWRVVSGAEGGGR